MGRNQQNIIKEVEMIAHACGVPQARLLNTKTVRTGINLNQDMKVYKLLELNEEVPDLVIQYLNRLSDFLFVLARFIAHENGAADVPWTARV